MKILLTGGTGLIGSAVLDRLVEDGHQVTGVVRSQSSSLAVEKAGAVGVIGDLSDRQWLSSELAQHDAAIHTAAGSDENDPAMDAAVIDAVIESFAGTDKPFVHTGGVWVYGDNDDITEDSELQPPALTAWRPAGEQRLLESEARASVVVPGIVHGNGGGIPATLLDGPLPGTGEQHWTTVQVDDLADLYVRALDAPGGQSYLGVSGHNPTVRELGEAIGTSEFAGDEATIDSLGAFGEALLLDQQSAGSRARADLGWEPTGPTLVDELRAGYVRGE